MLFAFPLFMQFKVVLQTFEPPQTVCPGYFEGFIALLQDQLSYS